MWAPIAEVVICVVLCVCLGKYFGLAGILVAFVISEFLIKMLWKPYFLFSRCFEISVAMYYWPVWIKYIAIMGIVAIATFFASNQLLHWIDSATWFGFVGYSLCIGTLVFLLMVAMYWVCDSHFRAFVNHIKSFRK